MPDATLILFCYNQEQFIREALLSCLAQEGVELEIIVSDDCSQDGTVRAATEVIKGYKGPHSVRLIANATNMGIAPHVDARIRDASSNIVLLCAGDDIQHPLRAQRTLSLFRQFSNASMVVLRAWSFSGDVRQAISQACAKPSLAKVRELSVSDFAKGQRLTLDSPARAVRKERFVRFPPLSRGYEDGPMMVRALKTGTVAVARDVGVYRRIHANNLHATGSLSDIIATNKQILKEIDDEAVIDGLDREKFNALKKRVSLRLRDTRIMRAIHRRKSGLTTEVFWIISSSEILIKNRIRMIYKTIRKYL